MVLAGDFVRQSRQFEKVDIVPRPLSHAESAPGRNSVVRKFAGLHLLFQSAKGVFQPLTEYLAGNVRQLRFRVVQIKEVDGFQTQVPRSEENTSELQSHV